MVVAPLVVVVPAVVLVVVAGVVVVDMVVVVAPQLHAPLPADFYLSFAKKNIDFYQVLTNM